MIKLTSAFHGLTFNAQCLLVAACLIGIAPASGTAADLTAREVTQMFFEAKGENDVVLSGKDLSFLDLSGLNFKAADLQGSNLHGTVLSESQLQGVNLKGANLDLTTLTRTNFSNANLEGASLLSVAFTTIPEPSPRETPIFTGANLKGAHIYARLDYADFSGADLSNVRFGPEPPRDARSIVNRPLLNGANFSGAKLQGAIARNVLLRFANFSGADLRDADLSYSDLSQADLTNADVSGANFTGTKLYGARLGSVQGLHSVKGLDAAIDLNSAIR